MEAPASPTTRRKCAGAAGSEPSWARRARVPHAIRDRGATRQWRDDDSETEQRIAPGAVPDGDFCRQYGRDRRQKVLGRTASVWCFAHYQTIDASGATSGARMVGDPRATFLAALASDGERFAILSAQAFSGVSGVSRVAPDGTLLDASPTAVTAAASSQLAFTGHDYLALSTDVTCTDACRVYGARVSQEGGLLTPTPTPVLTRATKPGGLDAATDGGLVLNGLARRHPDLGITRRERRQLARPAGFPIATDASAKSSCTRPTRRTLAVVWRDVTTRDLYGAASRSPAPSPTRRRFADDLRRRRRLRHRARSDGQWLVVTTASTRKPGAVTCAAGS